MERKEAVKKDGLDAHLLDHEKLPPVDQQVDRTLFEQPDPLQARKEASDGAGPSGAAAGPSQ